MAASAPHRLPALRFETAPSDDVLPVGPFLDVRFIAAFGDGPASRLSTAEVGIRFGYELDFPAREEGDPEEGSRWRP